MATNAYKCILSSLHLFLGGGRMTLVTFWESPLALRSKITLPFLSISPGLFGFQEFVLSAELKHMSANNSKEPRYILLRG